MLHALPNYFKLLAQLLPELPTPLSPITMTYLNTNSQIAQLNYKKNRSTKFIQV